ncbi:cationic amino acid transporter 4-like [Littorina saxatilis]|uniref:Cationic amino acid transporter C-terminal domain-containing protein n=1 Tax=Littorina saxatilis TaxID=31220 RepID=A0AAN9G3R1_9CAEN
MECGARLRYVWNRAGRQKLVAQDDTHTNLHRCLSTLQMTAIGIGSTIGVGIYVLLGVAIRDMAGPGVILSFFLAGLVVLSNALIYMEFGSYIPHTGAAYTYIYRAVGELAAFLTGWMGLLSLTCSAATGARAWSGFVDSLFNNSVQNFLDDKVGQLDLGSPFSHSLDWMAFTFFLLVTLVVSCNVHCSSIINTVLAVLTTGVLVFVMIFGPIIGDIGRLAAADNGGFLPYGMGGVVTGASAAFFAFNGYDSICISAEEAKDPIKSVPRAILLELLIVVIVYCGAAVGTLCLIPYTEIDLRAPIPSAFAYQGVTWAKYIVTIGPIIAITNLSILGLYAASRISYRMAQDGLLMKQFSYINARTKVPLLGVVVFGVLVAVISLVLELKDLVRFSVLCMLFQYMILAPALVALRVADREKQTSELQEAASSGESALPQANEDRDAPHPRLELRTQGSSESDGVGYKDEDGLVHYTDRGNTLFDPDSPNPTTDSHLLQDPLASTRSNDAGGKPGFGGNTENPNSNGAARSPQGVKTVITTDSSGPSDANANFATELTDTTLLLSSEMSQSEDNTAVSKRQHKRASDARSSDFADESQMSEERFKSRNSILPLKLKTSSGANVGEGCFEITRREFFKILSTKMCLGLLVLVLGGLAVQLGMGWEDLRRANLLAVVSTTLMIVVIVFLCEVVRKRCGPGHHEGFKVPLVPYLPMLSCFLNMLLLVSAADVMGIIEFTVLVLLGLVIYVIMMMTQWKKDGDDSKTLSIQSEETYALLSQEENDADSEGSL